MGALDLLWHVLNLIAPALGLGVIAATGAKLLWRRELARVRWGWLALATGFDSALALLGGLWLTGHDGSMFTYAAMVLGCAFGLWWHGVR